MARFGLNIQLVFLFLCVLISTIIKPTTNGQYLTEHGKSNLDSPQQDINFVESHTDLNTERKRRQSEGELLSMNGQLQHPVGGNADGAESSCLPGQRRQTTYQTVTYKTECVMCTLSPQVNCTPGDIKITEGEGEECMLEISAELLLPGCNHKCQTNISFVSCCYGYWGPDCQDCPGGAENPCSSYGECRNDGTCGCFPAFNGTACELCANGRFGPKCRQECTCEHGKCNEGPDEDGSCDCYEGYTGQRCEQERQVPLQCDPKCGVHSHCEYFPDRLATTCVCDYGYEWGVSKIVCIEKDGCNPHPCAPEAKCQRRGLGGYTCTCPPTHLGDGQVCLPIDPCQVNMGECPVTTECIYTAPNERECRCKEGYTNYVSGVGCSLIDICDQPLRDDDEPCHIHANCTTIAPLVRDCTCREGFTGDGYICQGNVMHVLEDLNKHASDFSQELYDILHVIHQSSSEEQLANGGFYTLFLPTDAANLEDEMAWFTTHDPLKHGGWLREHVVGTFSHPPLTLRALTGSQHTLYTLSGSQVNVTLLPNGLQWEREGQPQVRARILRPNIPAENAVIHLIDTPLYPKAPSSLTNFLSVVTALQLIGGMDCAHFINFLQLTEVADDLSDEENDWTIFVPRDSSWNALDEGMLEHLSDVRQRGLLTSIIKQHIIPGKHSILDLVQTKPVEIRTLGGTMMNVHGTEYGAVVLDSSLGVNAQIIQSDIPTRNGFLHLVDGLIVPTLSNPMVPRRCDIETTKTILTLCQPCFLRGSVCPQGTKEHKLQDICGIDHPMPTFPFGTLHDHDLRDRFRQLRPILKCSFECRLTTTESKCCAGFYGSECFSCPGGFRNPCNGHGVCDDGLSGTGQCSCEAGYTEAACEFCSNAGRFGNACNLTCHCIHGTCDQSSNDEAGHCVPFTCLPGYEGIDCERQMELCNEDSEIQCHAHALCIKSREKNPDFRKRDRRGRQQKWFDTSECVCTSGYLGDGFTCTEINACELPTRGGCHFEAICIKTGPGLVQCECDEGWQGDGFECWPATLCKSDSCPEHSICIDTAPGVMECICEEWYNKTEDGACQLIDVCLNQHGGCHPRALCETTGPGLVNCTCGDDTEGDGFNECLGDLMYELQNVDEATSFSAWISNVTDGVEMLSESNITLLVPSNSAWLIYSNSSLSKWPDRKLKLLVMYHMADLGGQNFSEMEGTIQIFTLSNWPINITSSTDSNETIINSARIIGDPISSLNGWIYLIDKVLEPTPFPVFHPTLMTVLGSDPELSLFTMHIGRWVGLSTKLEALPSLTILAPVNSAWDGIDHEKVSQRWLRYLAVTRDIAWDQIKKSSVEQLPTALNEDTRESHIFVASSKDTVYFNDLPVNLVTKAIPIDNGVVFKLDRLLILVLNTCTPIGVTTAVTTANPRSLISSTTSNVTYIPSQPLSPTNDNESTLNPTFQTSGTSPPSGLEQWIKAIESTEIMEGTTQSLNTMPKAQECCPGFYGDECNPCPGPTDQVCSGHGYCLDGAHSNGTCVCQYGYSGEACEDCNSDVLACDSDPCTVSNGGCSVFSNCVYSQGALQCTACELGLVQHGLQCITPCHSAVSPPCHYDATCKYNFTSQNISCNCNPGFLGDGSQCYHERGSCRYLNGGCHRNARCQPTNMTDMWVNDEVYCECLPGYVGDGWSCTGTLWETVNERNDTHAFLHYLQTTLSSEEQERTKALLSDLTLHVVLLWPQTLTLETPSDKTKLTPDTSLWNYVAIVEKPPQPDIKHDSWIPTKTQQGRVFELSPSCFYTHHLSECQFKNAPNISVAIATSNGLLVVLKTPFARPLTTPKSSFTFKPSWVGGTGAVLCVFAIVILISLWLRRRKAPSSSTYTFSKFDNDDEATGTSSPANSIGQGESSSSSMVCQNEAFMDLTFEPDNLSTGSNSSGISGQSLLNSEC